MTTPWQPGFQGVTVIPAGYNDPHNWSPAPAPQLVTATPAAGVPLVNGTPTILTWTAPNDNQLHEINLIAALAVASPETGGTVTLNFTFPGGAAAAPTAFAAGLAAGSTAFQVNRLVAPGTTVTLVQTGALTAGAATLFAQLWAS